MTDLTELVLITYGFADVAAWRIDPLFGRLTAEEIMRKAGYKSAAAWEAEVMPLHREIKKALMDALLKLWYAIGRQADPNQLKVYADAFDGYPPELINQAVDHLLTTHGYTSVPTIAEILEAIRVVVDKNYAEFAV